MKAIELIFACNIMTPHGIRTLLKFMGKDKFVFKGNFFDK